MMKDHEITILDYNNIEFGKHIGSGITSDVYKGFYDGKEYAFKVYTSENEIWNDKGQMLEAFNYELITANECHRLDRIVKTYGYCFNEYSDNFSIIIMMELLDSIGDLFDYLQQKLFWNDIEGLTNKGCNMFGIYNYESNIFWKFTMSEKRKQKISIDIIKAIQELHQNNIIHGDIKTNNLVYHKSSNYDKSIVKVIDLGVCYNKCNNECISLNYYIGTDGYMAPEQLKHKLHYKSDIYSVGVTIIEVWNGEIWLSGKGFKVCRNEVLKALRKIESKYKSLGKVLRKCICMDYNKRPTLDHVLEVITNL